MAETPITELDFFQVRQNLKEYLQSQDRFKDYNFEGSNLSVLLDVLSYNTYYNNFYTNMALNEMFIDTAQIRESVVSHAKSLGYTPRSRSSARAVIRLTLTVNDTPNFIIVPAKTKFTAQCGNKNYTFYNDKAVTIYPQVVGDGRSYEYPALPVFEGQYVTEVFKVNGDPNQKFILSNSTIDTSSIEVEVRQSSSVTSGDQYILKSSVLDSTSTSKFVYIQGAEDDKYELYFGKGVFGNQPKNGNVVRVTYRVTNGDDANGAANFTISERIAGYPVSVGLVTRAEGGAERETIDSIKYFAPRSIQIQDRAITESDYEILLKSEYPEVQAVAVYGGEELNPPRYGKVVVAVDTKTQYGVSSRDKTKYTQYLSARSPLGIEPIVVSPDFMFFSITADVKVNTKMTTLSESEIQDKVVNAIMRYSTNGMSDFKSTLRSSKLSTLIDAVDKSIMSNMLTVRPILPIVPRLGGVQNRFVASFGNALLRDHVLKEGDSIVTYRPAVKSSSYTLNRQNVFLQDDGTGNIHVMTLNGSKVLFVVKNVGKVNYTTGRIDISNLRVNGYKGSEIRLFGKTVSTDITAPKNRIGTIRKIDLDINVIGA